MPSRTLVYMHTPYNVHMDYIIYIIYIIYIKEQEKKACLDLLASSSSLQLTAQCICMHKAS